MTDWHLHPQLADETHPLGIDSLCEWRLMDDANYPWLILVPRVAGATELIKAFDHGVKVGIAEQPTGMQHSGVGLGRKNVVRREHPVKMGGLAQCGHRLGRATGKAAAPQGAFVGTVLFDHCLFQ